MAFDLLAPVRLGIRIGIGVLRFELRILEQLIDPDAGQEAPPAPAYRPPTARPAAPMDVPTAAPPVTRDAPPAFAEQPPEPAHIDDEPELVAESSDPGAEEGAGAELHVDEPWHGYRSMSAADVRDRVALADPAQVAIVQLYESTHRKRRTVLEAAERRGRELANAPAR
ncbi:MAG TPA: hypothetical protein VH247_09170 [Thermoleophilaceae bacterium]|jgi:hypothetical protein|nr:hypothetical protein [Thermoleophilaceae bacterium]